MIIDVPIRLQPKQTEFKKAAEKYSVVFFGGARGGGKSYGLRNIILLRCLQTPRRQAGIFRKSYPELESNHIRPLFNEHPYLKTYYNESKKVLALPNGSTINFCYCESEKDVSRYQGQEFSDLAIDEAGQWTEQAFRTLHGSNRSSITGVKPVCLVTANPGGIGHGWLKRLFITRKYNEREIPGDYYFIQSLIADNPALIENDPAYVNRLNAEPNEALRKAYLYGDWDILAGQYFTEIRREVHLVEPFKIPEHWYRFGSYDYGFTHPAVFQWFAADEDGNVFLYRELCKAGLRIDQFAAELNKFADTRLLQSIVAGLDCWQTKSTLRTGTPPTIAEEFLEHGISLRRASTDRILGANQVRNYLAWQELPSGRKEPRLKIFNICEKSYDTLARMQHDPDRPEDVLKVDATEGDPDSGDDCFIAGTMITTNKGQKPIELICPGDLVLTRKGFKTVIDQWINKLNSETMTIVASDGRTLTGTLNHKLLINDSFNYMDTVNYGDKILCLNQKLLSLTESSLEDIPCLSAHTLETISGLVEITDTEVLARFMSKFGKQNSAKSPKDFTFITRMGIRSTMNWKIWSAWMLKHMLLSISKTQSEWTRLENTWTTFAPQLLFGMEAMLASNGTANIGTTHSEKNCQTHLKSKKIVSFAPQSFIQKIQQKLNFALITAKQKTEENQLKLKRTAPFAVKNFNTRQITNQFQAPVHLNVVGAFADKKQTTYCLHVDNCHEYYANGILVSNCYDSLRYGLMSRPLMADQLKVIVKPGTKEYVELQQKLIEEKLQYDIDRQTAEQNENDYMVVRELDELDAFKYYAQQRNRR